MRDGSTRARLGDLAATKHVAPRAVFLDGRSPGEPRTYWRVGVVVATTREGLVKGVVWKHGRTGWRDRTHNDWVRAMVLGKDRVENTAEVIAQGADDYDDLEALKDHLRKFFKAS